MVGEISIDYLLRTINERLMSVTLNVCFVINEIEPPKKLHNAVIELMTHRPEAATTTNEASVLVLSRTSRQ